MGRTATIYRVEDATRAERFGVRPMVLGGANGVWQRLRKGLPGLYARDGEGWLAGAGWRMRLSTWRQFLPSSRGAVDSIEVDVEGSGDPLPVLVALCRQQGWSLFDDEAGCFVDLADPAGMSWNGEPLAAVPPPSTLAMMLWPPALRRELVRREIVLLDLDGPPNLDGEGPIHRFPLGHADDVRAHFVEVLPEMRWSGRLGRSAVDDMRMDVVLRATGLVDTLRISVSGLAVDEWLMRICEPVGWSALEPSIGEFSYLHETAREPPPVELPPNVIALRRR